MEENKIAVGLDIGTTKIVAMIGRRNEYGKLEVIGSGNAKSIGVKRGVVTNITQTIQSIQQAIDEAEAASGYKINDVSVGIAGQHIRSLHHSDYITRLNPEAVIDSDDIEEGISGYIGLHLLDNGHTTTNEIARIQWEGKNADEEDGWLSFWTRDENILKVA